MKLYNLAQWRAQDFFLGGGGVSRHKLFTFRDLT